MNNQKAEKIILTFIVFLIYFSMFFVDISKASEKEFNLTKTTVETTIEKTTTTVLNATAMIAKKEQYITAKLPKANIKLVAESNYGNITVIRFKDCKTSRNYLFESCQLRTMIINTKKLNAVIAIQR
jgi:hypothetical protein